MSAPNRIDAAFSIHKGERPMVLLLLLQYFFTGMASGFTQTAGFALFLGAFDAGDLPYTYMLMALILSPMTLAYLQAEKSLSFPGLLTLNFAAQIIITLGCAIGLAVISGNWLVFLLPVLFQIVVVFGNMAFWSLAGRMLNVRQGKRLFGLVGSGEWLGILAVGLLMPVTVPLIGLANLLWLTVISMIAAMIAMTLNVRRHRSLLVDVPSAASPQSPPPSVPISQMIGNPYVLLMLALTVIWWVAFFFVDNIFYDQAAAQIPDSEELAFFLGIYLSVLSVLTLLGNTFVVGPIIGRFGLRSSLLILPAGLCIGALVMSLTGLLDGPLVILFLFAVATKVWGLGVGFSIDQSARSILYQPLPPALRTRVQTFADGVAQPFATGIAGAALLALGLLFPGSSLPLMIGLVALGLALLAIVLLAGRGYAKALLEALDKRRLTAGTGFSVFDATSLAILRRELQGSRPGSVAYALRTLGEIDPQALATELPGLLAHREADVRRHALETVGSLGLAAALPAVRKALDREGLDDLRELALRTLGRLGDGETPLRHLDATQPALRAGAILGLLENGNARAAYDAIGALCRSDEASERTEAARLLGECGGTIALTPLQALLDDRDVAVRKNALRAAGHVKSPVLWPQVIAALETQATHNSASAALVAGGASSLPVIAERLKSGGTGSSLRVSLAKICGRIRDSSAIEPLLSLIGTQDVTLRSAALHALSQCGYRASRADSAMLHRLIETESELAAWLTAAMLDLGEDALPALLREALAAQVLGCRENVLNLLGFMGDATALKLASANLASRQASKVAYALEVIDIQTPVSLRADVLPLMEVLTPDERLARLKPRHPQDRMGRQARLAEVAAISDARVNAWTRSCALHAATTPVDTDHKDKPMLSIIEKVIILRNAGIFADTADQVLADVAAVAAVSEARLDEAIIRQGEVGDSMFIIASGRVRVHDGARHLNDLATGDVFGEMALLDPETRSASVTAIEDTLLLRLDQQVLFELIEDRPEVALGLLRVLSRRLRTLVQNAPANPALELQQQ